MRSRVDRLAALSAAVVTLVSIALAVPAVGGDEAKLSISGYDPVAYFTDSRPVAGKPEYEFLWHKLRWRFASSDHRDRFVCEPGRYAPQYDGYCAMGVTNGEAAHKDTVDPGAWAIVDGKLYLAHNRYWIEKWREQAAEKIKQGDRDWAALKGSAGAADRRAPLRRIPADDTRRAERRRALGRRRRAGGA